MKIPYFILTQEEHDCHRQFFFLFIRNLKYVLLSNDLLVDTNKVFEVLNRKSISYGSGEKHERHLVIPVSDWIKSTLKIQPHIKLINQSKFYLKSVHFITIQHKLFCALVQMIFVRSST